VIYYRYNKKHKHYKNHCENKVFLNKKKSHQKRYHVSHLLKKDQTKFIFIHLKIESDKHEEQNEEQKQMKNEIT
jgi:predicted RNase H-related nuclease YkuK (DUF458 family)